MVEIRLPAYVFEPNLAGYVVKLLDGSQSGSIIMDFEAVRFYIPAAIVATLAQIGNWQQNGQEISFRNHTTNPVCGYLQRIDFFRRVGLELPEPGRRHNGTGRFVPIEQISRRKGDAASISSRMAECISPGGWPNNDAYQLAQYACAEVINNCKQHANGTGFVSAQYAPKRDTAWVSIADCGRGICASFEENRSPHHFPGMTDLEAIQIALKPKVSSTTHLAHQYGSSPNKGVGLSMMRYLVQETLGYMVIISGSGWWYQDGNKRPLAGTFPNGLRFCGTICSVAFKRSNVADYNAMLQQARIALGLTGEATPGNLFL